MGSQHRSLISRLGAVTIVGLLLASCAGSSMKDQAAAPPVEVQAEPEVDEVAADSIVVT